MKKDEGIAKTRDIILKAMGNLDISASLTFSPDTRHAFMIDDDIKFAYKPHAKKYIVPSPEQMEEMIREMCDMTNEHFPIGGISARQFSNDKHDKYDHNTRIIQVYCFYLPIVLNTGIRFSYSGQPFMTDYRFIMSYLKEGYPNIVLNRFTRDDNSQTPGGCFEQRTADNHSKSAIALYRQFPDCTRLVNKYTGTWKELRVNAQIQWKKCFASKYENASFYTCMNAMCPEFTFNRISEITYCKHALNKHNCEGNANMDDCPLEKK